MGIRSRRGRARRLLTDRSLRDQRAEQLFDTVARFVASVAPGEINLAFQQHDVLGLQRFQALVVDERQAAAVLIGLVRREVVDDVPRLRGLIEVEFPTQPGVAFFVVVVGVGRGGGFAACLCPVKRGDRWGSERRLWAAGSSSVRSVKVPEPRHRSAEWDSTADPTFRHSRRTETWECPRHLCLCP